MSSECPVKSSTSPSVNKESTNLQNPVCPIHDQHYDKSISDYSFNHEPQFNQKSSLSTVRAVSTIPKSDITPAHQPNNISRWVYPSEQQYYNAMKKKGYNPNESDVPAILYIHNMVNEEGWRRIKEWELIRNNTNPVLQRFQGRPKDLSPKALILHYLLGYSLPFDRHDWFINRNGREVRYVIDFYKGSRIATNSAVSIHLDVRPALDSTSAFFDLSYYYYRKAFKPWTLPKTKE